jgi:hypothetical protein
VPPSEAAPTNGVSARRSTSPRLEALSTRRTRSSAASLRSRAPDEPSSNGDTTSRPSRHEAVIGCSSTSRSPTRRPLAWTCSPPSISSGRGTPRSRSSPASVPASGVSVVVPKVAARVGTATSVKRACISSGAALAAPGRVRATSGSWPSSRRLPPASASSLGAIVRRSPSKRSSAAPPRSGVSPAAPRTASSPTRATPVRFGWAGVPCTRSSDSSVPAAVHGAGSGSRARSTRSRVSRSRSPAARAEPLASALTPSPSSAASSSRSASSSKRTRNGCGARAARSPLRISSALTSARAEARAGAASGASN